MALKVPYGRWSDKVDAELVEIRNRLDAIEAKLSNMGVNTQGYNPNAPHENDDTSTPRQLMGYTQNRLHKQGEAFFKAYSDTGMDDEEGESYTHKLMENTYLLNQATISIRGYSMLLEEMGLSKDQKRMLSELNEIMMMVQKVASTIRILSMFVGPEAIALGSAKGILNLILAGGVGAGSLAYGSKVSSGNV
jgi:hypothetical protein